MNHVQEEISGVIEGEGMVLDAPEDQLYAALRLMVLRLTGGRLEFIAAGNLTAGDPLLVQDTFGVVEASVLATFPAAILLRGVYPLPKVAAQAWTAGQALYWNGAALTTTAAGNRRVGVAATDELAAATTGDALLSGPPNLV